MLSAVDFLAVADLYDDHGFCRIVDLVEDAVVALANAIFLRAAELLAAIWPWIACQQLDLSDDALTVGLLKISDLLGRRTPDSEAIASHVA